MEKVARFVACEMVEGDYLEFGVYRGATFINAYRSLERQFAARISQDTGGENEESARKRREELWSNMRFFAFDSFEGLPELTSDDVATPDFEKGQYGHPVEQFEATLRTRGIPAEKTRIIKGWFKDSCTRETAREHELKKAAVVWIDADLYSSTKTALTFITDLIQDGTILIFDDWFSYRGSPYAGEQRAFREWLTTIEGDYSVQEYHRESWKRMSFIVSRKPSRSETDGEQT